MKLKDGQVSKVTPVAMEVAVPIAEDAVNDGAQIQLGKGVSSIMRRSMPGMARAASFI